ncbi:MAG: hypothetical protein ACXVC6_07470 [Bacteroidia bacterium]
MVAYKTIESEIKGDIHITVDSQYNHIEAGKVIVGENIIARLFGTVNELIVIKKDATVFLHGKLKGKIQNEGGKLHIY